jgi:hypothetical protein
VHPGFLQIIENGASSGPDGALIVGLVSGLAGALAAGIVGFLSYRATLRSAKAQLAAARLAAVTQREAAKRTAEVQIETIRIQAELEYRKLRASHVTAERLRWLQDLRLRLARLFRDLDAQVDLARRPRAQDQKGHELRQAQLDEISARVSVEVHVIWLLLNPEKPPQAALREAISQAQEFVLLLSTERGAALADIKDYQSYKQSAFDALTEVGVVAWQKIQDLQ